MNTDNYIDPKYADNTHVTREQMGNHYVWTISAAPAEDSEITAEPTVKEDPNKTAMNGLTEKKNRIIERRDGTQVLLIDSVTGNCVGARGLTDEERKNDNEIEQLGEIFKHKMRESEESTRKLLEEYDKDPEGAWKKLDPHNIVKDLFGTDINISPVKTVHENGDVEFHDGTKMNAYSGKVRTRENDEEFKAAFAEEMKKKRPLAQEKKRPGSIYKDDAMDIVVTYDKIKDIITLTINQNPQIHMQLRLTKRAAFDLADNILNKLFKLKDDE